MTAMLVVSLSANMVLGVMLMVRMVRPDDRLEASALAAAIDFALHALTIIDGRQFLRALRNVSKRTLAALYPRWPDYRDRHMAISQDLTV